jgi:hypothetical protein
VQVLTIQPLNAGYGGYGFGRLWRLSWEAGAAAAALAASGVTFPLGRGASTTARHDLTIFMREVSSQQVVYETVRRMVRLQRPARGLPAMMDAALTASQPPAGTSASARLCHPR